MLRSFSVPCTACYSVPILRKSVVCTTLYYIYSLNAHLVSILQLLNHFYGSSTDQVDIQQVVFEATARQAWHSDGLETVKELAQKHLKEKGWDDVHPALSVTVRAWIMRGAFESHLSDEPQASVQFLKQAIDLLEWERNILPRQTVERFSRTHSCEVCVVCI
ncbi:hypothetical protein DFH29DRAFT_369679 [Suillus ampliporus]|nr:hypothetical protein DFH29DRAFT_369679 [Suillus ampliporus]